jgi:hypothetical protein
MEKDIDEVGKVSRYIKSKVEELDKEVRPFLLFSALYYLGCSCCSRHASSFLCDQEFRE